MSQTPSSAHRHEVRQARGQSRDYSAKNAARRQPEAVANRKRKVAARRPPTPTQGRDRTGKR